ncbi:flagellar protein FlaG [Phytopseudomonas flavescens]|nr:flagellar protein FlaG [Pseudomonas flavescens]
MSITTVNQVSAPLAPAVTGLQGSVQGSGAKSSGVATGNTAGASNAAGSVGMSQTGMGEAIAKMQDYAQSVRRNLDFQLDDSTGRVVVQVINSDSGEVIRQIPSEEVLELASRLEDARSLLLQEKA